MVFFVKDGIIYLFQLVKKVNKVILLVYTLYLLIFSLAIYSTVIDFEDWVFPHGNLPAPWRSITTSPIPATTTMADELPYATRDVTISRDQSCRITQSRAGIEQAHIIPKAQENWFSSNDMSRYSYNEASAPAIHDIANTLLLRADVHHMLDQKELVIVPKRQRTLEGIRYHLVTHVLHARMRYLFEQQALYHNRKCQELYEIPIEFLFARFAWTIFNNFTIRLLETKNSPFYILIRSDSETDQSKMVTHYIRNLTDLRAISRGRWNVETTETSRKRTRDANDEEGLYYSYAKGRLVDIDQEPDWYQESGTELDDEEFERARKRERLNDENLPSLSQSVGSIGSSDEGIRDLDQDGMEKQELSVDNLGVKQPMPIRFQD